MKMFCESLREHAKNTIDFEKKKTLSIKKPPLSKVSLKKNL